MHTRSALALSLATLAAAAIISHAGPLNPPAGPVTPTYKTLSEVEPRIPLSQSTTPGDAANVYIITQPGSYYLTAETIGTAGKNGIRIATSNVRIDLNGYRLVGVPGSLSGITLPVSGQRNITIKDGVVSSFGLLGIDLSLVRNCIITDIQVTDNGGNGLHLGESAAVTRCIFNGNGGHGCFAGPASVLSACSARQNGGDGLSAGAASAVTACSAVLNGRGIFGGFGSSITECSVYDNDGDGFFLASGASISRCSARANDANGINTSGGNCHIRDNNCSANGQGVTGGAGIRVTGGDSRLEGNTCTGQTRGIEADGGGNIIIRNTCAGNTTNWEIIAGNIVAPIVQTSTNAAAIAGNTFAGSLNTTDPNANFTY